MNRHNWEVCVYDKDCKIVKRWVIEDRTERDADKEAEANVDRIPNCFDWTLTQIN